MVSAPVSVLIWAPVPGGDGTARKQADKTAPRSQGELSGQSYLHPSNQNTDAQNGFYAKKMAGTFLSGKRESRNEQRVGPSIPDVSVLLLLTSDGFYYCTDAGVITPIINTVQI